MTRLLTLVAVLAAALVGSRSASAQMSFNMGMGDFDGSIPRASLGRYAKVLGMDADQTAMAETLHEGYLTAHKATMKEMQEVIADISRRAQEDRDWSLFRTEMPERMKVFTERMQETQGAFLEDVKALLTDEQRARWPTVERMRRRDEGLRFGMISGAGVDVIAIADNALGETPRPEEVAAVLGRYEMEMDAALVEFEEAGKEMQDKAMDAASNMDMGAISEMMKTLEESGKALRDLNQRYARLVSPLLPAEAAAAFDLEVKRRGFPRVYRETLTEKSLAAAERFSDLTPDQAKAMASIREAYDRESGSAREAWAAAIQQQEDTEGGRFSGMMSGAMGEAKPGGSAVSDARKAAEELDESTLDKLRTLLTDAQKERLPTKADLKQSDDPMDVMFGGG